MSERDIELARKHVTRASGLLQLQPATPKFIYRPSEQDIKEAQANAMTAQALIAIAAWPDTEDE